MSRLCKRINIIGSVLLLLVLLVVHTFFIVNISSMEQGGRLNLNKASEVETNGRADDNVKSAHPRVKLRPPVDEYYDYDDYDHYDEPQYELF